MKKYLSISLILFLLPMLLLAQTRTTNRADLPEEEEEDVPTRAVLWSFSSTQGEYKVKVNSIQSVSMQTYTVDAIATVYEVNVGTSSPVQARFYFIEPVTPEVPSRMGQHAIDTAKQRLEQLRDRVDTGDLTHRVQKSYPTTTHAKTIEYRMCSKSDLERLYRSVEKSFRSQRARSVKFSACK